MLYEERVWIGGLVVRSALPIVHCRDDYFGFTQYRVAGRIPDGKSIYWLHLNRIVNMARAFVNKEFQGLGFGSRMIRLLEDEGMKMWETKYDFRPIGIDCLDNAPPEKARIFLQNGWEFLGTTGGYSHPRGYKSGKVKLQAKPIEGRMKQSSCKWYVYAKKLENPEFPV